MLRRRVRGILTATAASLVLVSAAFAWPVAALGAGTPGVSIDWERPIPTTSGVAAIQAMASLGGDVLVAGQVSGSVPGGVAAGGGDLWVARYDRNGGLVWITQFGTDSTDVITSIAASTTGIYVGGWTLGSFGSAALAAKRDFVARLTPAGTFEWARESEQAPDSPGASVALAPGGDVVASLTDHTAGPAGAGFVGSIRRYRADGSLAWERTITACCGTTQPLTDVVPSALAADPGGFTVTGFSIGSILPSTMPGATGGFVQRYGFDGSIRWTSYVGVSRTWGPMASGIVASEAGIWVSGTSSHPITGEADRWPDENPFLRRHLDSGEVQWTKAIAARHTAPDCSSILAIGDIPAAAEPARGTGSYVERISPAGAKGWRFEATPAPEQLVAFLGVVPTPERVFLGIERENSAYSVAALAGVPARADCDKQAPAVSAPSARFLPGTTLTSSIPVRLSWSASDPGSGMAGFDVLRQSDGAAWVTMFERQLPMARDVNVRAGHVYRFGVRGFDRASSSTLAVSASTRVVRYEDNSSRVSYRGLWRTSPYANASGGSTHASSTAGASATFSFTGRAVAWVAPVSSARGSARVYVDGGYVGTVKLTTSTGASRRVVFARSWSAVGRHTVRLVVVGTAGHPRVDVDAFVTLE
jgi:hypothetical protein